MNFFETELKKLMSERDVLEDQTYVGRTCYGKLGKDLRARIEFVTMGVANHYDGVKASIINRTDGVVDSMVFRFSDVWGRRKVNNPNFRDGIMPHIWQDNGKTSWYVFKPSKEDYSQLAEGIESYLAVFQDLAQGQAAQEQGGQQMG